MQTRRILLGSILLLALTVEAPLVSASQSDELSACKRKCSEPGSPTANEPRECNIACEQKYPAAAACIRACDEAEDKKPDDEQCMPFSSSDCAEYDACTSKCP